MTAKIKIQSRKLTDLVVQGYDSTEKSPLPTAYTREYIPVDISHIPTPERANGWAHLKGIFHRIQYSTVGSWSPNMIQLHPGTCTQKLTTGEGNEPFAVDTDLGWSIIGCFNICGFSEV